MVAKKMIQWDFSGIYPLVNIQKTMEHHHFRTGTINYFDWAIFSIATQHFFPEGHGDSPWDQEMDGRRCQTSSQKTMVDA